MNKAQIVPTLSLMLNLGSSIIWFWQGDWRRGTYWLAAAVITAVVTY